MARRYQDYDDEDYYVDDSGRDRRRSAGRSGRDSERRPRPRRRPGASAPVPKGSKSRNKNSKPPMLLRFLSWLGVILLCFVAGYIGTSWTIDKLNKKIFLKPENRVSNQEELNALQQAEQERARTATTGSNGESVQQITLNIHYVKNNTLTTIQRSFVARALEDNIADALRAIFELSDIPDSDKINVVHVFRNGDTAFLDLSSSFASSVSSMQQRTAQLLLTGIVRTLQENFSPVTKARFLIESQTPKSGGPVALTALWQLPAKK